MSVSLQNRLKWWNQGGGRPKVLWVPQTERTTLGRIKGLMVLSVSNKPSWTNVFLLENFDSIKTLGGERFYPIKPLRQFVYSTPVGVILVWLETSLSPILGPSGPLSAYVRIPRLYQNSPRDIFSPDVASVTTGSHNTTVRSVCGGDSGGERSMHQYSFTVADLTDNVDVRLSSSVTDSPSDSGAHRVGHGGVTSPVGDQEEQEDGKAQETYLRGSFVSRFYTRESPSKIVRLRRGCERYFTRGVYNLYIKNF